jgi:Porin subfamily
MTLRAFGTLLCGAVALGAIQAGITPAKADDKQDLILRRLEALERENAALKNRLQRVEGAPARTSGAPVVSRAPAPQGPQSAMASAPPAGAAPAKAPVAFTCDRYGPGFYGIPGVPGMSGCLKIGGYIRAQGAWGASGDGIPTGADAMAPQGVQTRSTFNDSNYHARAAISLDARLPTAWGDVRGYARFGAEIDTPFGTTFPANAANTPLVPNLPNAPVLFWDRGYIQYVGATIGKARSFFDLFALTDGYLTYGNPRASGDTNLTGVVLAGYTAKFGDGFSASVSVEDPNGHNKVGPLNFAVTPGWGLGTLATTQLGGQGLNQRGYSVPDIIGNLRVDQSWGYVGVTGAIHQVAASYYTAGAPAPCGGPIEACGNPSNRYGWAVSGGGQVIIPGTLRDTFGANVVYSEGAVGFATRGALWQLYRSSNSAGFGWANDGIYDNTSPGCVGLLNCQTAIQLTQAWSINAAYEHIWSAEWKTSAYGSYAAISYNQTATNIINSHLPGASGTTPCPVPVAGAVQPPLGIPVGSDNSCSPNYSFWTVGSRTQYSPVAWLDLGVDVFYTHFNTAYRGTNVTLAGNGGRPAGPYTIEDQHVLTLLARAQLNFNP